MGTTSVNDSTWGQYGRTMLIQWGHRGISNQKAGRVYLKMEATPMKGKSWTLGHSIVTQISNYVYATPKTIDKQTNKQHKQRSKYCKVLLYDIICDYSNSSPAR